MKAGKRPQITLVPRRGRGASSQRICRDRSSEHAEDARCRRGPVLPGNGSLDHWRKKICVPPDVSREDLVSAITAEHHLDVLPRQLCQKVERESRRNGEWLVGMPNHLRQPVDQVRSEIELVVP